MKRLYLLSLLLVASAAATASPTDSIASPLIELQVDKIVLYPDRMGMTGSESLMECLQSLPSLVQKGNVNIVDNFIIEENDNSYLQDPTIYLEQTRISEVDHIEITTDGSVSSGLSGVVGVINVILKDPKEGTHAHLDMLANTNGEVYPTFYLTHSRGSFVAMGSIMGLFDRDKQDVYNYSGSQLTDHNKLLTRYRDEAMKTQFKWTLPKDEVTLKVSQYYGKDRVTNDYFSFASDDASQSSTTGYTSTRKISVSTDYNHYFSPATVLKFSFGLESIIKSSDLTNVTIDADDASNQDVNSLDDNYQSTANWSANVKLEKKFSTVAMLKVAVPMSWKLAGSHLYQLASIYGPQRLYKQDIDGRVDNYNPYVQLDLTPHSKWAMSFGAREVISHYMMDQSDYAKWTNTRYATIYTATVDFTPRPRHTLQANFHHSAGMPTVDQICPNLWFYQSPNVFYQGNEDLKTSTFDVWTLSYALNLPRLQLSSSLQYYVNHNNVITSTITDNGNYICYQTANADRNNVVNYNVSAVWIYRQFQLMAGASIYNKRDQQDHFKSTWCCLRLVPTLQLPEQISLSAQLSYVSPQSDETARYNASWYGLVRAAKRWDCGLSVFVYWENFLQNSSVTTGLTQVAPIPSTSTDFHENKVSFGISYTFM